jgi:hypothetical protein
VTKAGRALVVAGVLAVLLGVPGCGAEQRAADGVRLPPPGAVFDYQLGGAYRPPAGVRVVVRDRTARPAGRYAVCYVNAFQTQPGAALRAWRRDRPELLLRDADGEPVVDERWGEALFDISTPARRRALAARVGAWIDGCAAEGFDAVELDNLDSFARSGGRLDEEDAVAFARLLTGRAHRAGLAAAQKNTVALLDDRPRTGFDFAVAEECAAHGECAAFTAAYGGRVFAVEYDRAAFAAACGRRGGPPLLLRDVELRPAGAPGHVRAWCRPPTRR